MKNILVAAMLLLSGCSVLQPSFINENALAAKDSGERIKGIDGPVNGHFNDDGEWIPDDPLVASTYKFPDVSAGFIVDVGDLHEVVVAPSLQIEILEIDTHMSFLGTLKADLGVSFMRGYIYVGKLFTSILEISAGFFIGWDFEDKEPAYGIAATIIRF